MTKTVRKREVNALFEYIYGLKDKCESINDINKNLITEYCRFAVLSKEVSQQILVEFDSNNPAGVTNLIECYKELNKILIGLYKTLKFDAIKDELKSEKNPYVTLLEEAGKGDDL